MLFWLATAWLVSAAPTVAGAIPPHTLHTASSPAVVSQTAILAGEPAPFTGVLFSNDRTQDLLQLAAEGKIARAGGYAITPWKSWLALATLTLTAGLETYREIRKK